MKRGDPVEPPPSQADWDLVACYKGCSRPWRRWRWRGKVWICPGCRTPWTYARGWVEVRWDIDVLAAFHEDNIRLRDARPYTPQTPTVDDIRAAVDSLPRQTIVCAPQDEHTIRAAVEALSSRARVLASPLLEPGTVYVASGDCWPWK